MSEKYQPKPEKPHECEPVNLCEDSAINKCDNETSTCQMLKSRGDVVCNCTQGYKKALADKFKCIGELRHFVSRV